MTDRFKTAFSRLAELSAISRLTDFSDSVQELILQTIAVGYDQNLKTARNLNEAIDSFFGIPLDEKTVSEELDKLLAHDRIRRDLYKNLRLSEAEESQRLKSIENTRENEAQVFDEWELSISESLTDDISFSDIREVLNQYLVASFRNHGIETARLLDSEAELSIDQSQSLSEILNAALQNITVSHRSEVRQLISGFFDDISRNNKKRKYILDLADGTFSFFCFYIDPDTRQRLYASLQRIEFFLDTNFLWGLLGLHENQYVEASVHFFHVSKENKLPFRFKYHKETEMELRKSINASANSLRSKDWPKQVSRTLSKSPYISGVERDYHQRLSKK